MPPTDRPDRLSALVSRFELDVKPVERSQANLVISRAPDATVPQHVCFTPEDTVPLAADGQRVVVFAARARWGGTVNPLINALPAQLDLGIEDDSEMHSLTTLLVAEGVQRRCGSGSVVNRLGEVLLVRLLRSLLSAGTAEVGLLGGLADPRLSAAIVAMHERPGQAWRIEQLALEAGLSTSRFADHFTRTVGQTPMAYLRNWRMVLARQDIEHGDRIQAIAARYGYASSEALSRAFRRHFGHSPIALRPHVERHSA